MKVVENFLPVIFILFKYVGDWTKDVAVIGVKPDIVLVGQDVTLSCLVKGCMSSTLEVHLYKWDNSKNQTLHTHKGTMQLKDQEKNSEEGIMSGSHRGRYKNGLLEVTLSQVQLTNSGKYVCALTCDDIYREHLMEITIHDAAVIGLKPDMVLVGQDVTLSCLVKGCNSSNLEVHLYKWENSKNQTLHIHNDTMKCKDQEKSKEEGIMSVSHRGQYKNGLLEVTLFQVQLTNSGKYVCALTCDDIYMEYLMEVIVQDEQVATKLLTKAGDYIRTVISVLNTKNYRFYFRLRGEELLFLAMATTVAVAVAVPVAVPVAVACLFFKKKTQRISRERDQMEAEKDQMKAEKEELIRRVDQMKAEKEELIRHVDQMKAEKEELIRHMDQMEAEIELSDAKLQKADVVLDPRTAHPRLEVSQNGKSVCDTGEDHLVSESEERFDSHTFILAKDGFTKGQHYWQVGVGQKKRWDLGIASESAPRKKGITLSPQNGYWVIGCDDGKDYWARTEEWTRLNTSGKLTKIGIFLNVSTRTLTFFNVLTKRKLHTYTAVGPGKLFPFFSTGSITKVPDRDWLEIE